MVSYHPYFCHCRMNVLYIHTGQLMCSVYVFSPITCMDYWRDGNLVIGTGNFISESTLDSCKHNSFNCYVYLL